MNCYALCWWCGRDGGDDGCKSYDDGKAGVMVMATVVMTAVR